MAREYFKCFHSYFEKTKSLTDAEVGRLFRALLKFSATGEAPSLAGRESIAFDFIADEIVRDQDAYANLCRQNAQNRAQRPSTTVNDRQRTATEGYENDKVEGIRNIKETSPNGDAKKMRDLYLDAWFKDFWTLYPRKIDKQDAAKAWKKLNPDEALYQSIIEGLRKWCKYWDMRKEPEFIPHPSRWINARRWESEPPEQAFRSVMNDEPKRKKNPALRYEQKPISKEDFDALTVDLTGGVT